MNKNYLISFSAELESKMDSILFQVPYTINNDVNVDENGNPVVKAAEIGAGAAGVGALGYGAYNGYNALQDRVKGMRSTQPGFTQLSPAKQQLTAAGDLAGDAFNATKTGLNAGKVAAGKALVRGGGIGRALLSGGKALINTLSSLEDKMDTVLFAMHEEKVESLNRGTNIVAAGGAAGVAGYAGYKGAKALSKHYGADQILDPKVARGAILNGIGRDAKVAAGTGIIKGARVAKVLGKALRK